MTCYCVSFVSGALGWNGIRPLRDTRRRIEGGCRRGSSEGWWAGRWGGRGLEYDWPVSQIYAEQTFRLPHPRRGPKKKKEARSILKKLRRKEIKRGSMEGLQLNAHVAASREVRIYEIQEKLLGK